MDSVTPEDLKRENEQLRERLEEAEAIVRAIRKHEVDAFVVEAQAGEEGVLVLDGVDKPYRLVIERMQQGAAILAGDGTLLYANGRLSELLGIPLRELIGKSFEVHVGPGHEKHFAQLLSKAPTEDTEREVVLLRTDGTALPALLNATPMIEPAGILCLIVTDMTQHKRYADEKERLIQEQAARAAAEKVAEVLRVADRRKDEFLAILGHELRNPLAPLRNGLQILQLIGSPDLASLQTREMMERQLDGLIRMVDDLLDVGRLTQGKIELHKEPADLKQVALRALEGCRPLIDERGHTVEIDLTEEPVPVEVDIVRLTQVITNILNNAAKFTPPRGIIRLSVAADRATGHALVCVRDNGIGIAPATITRIFELFAQADPSLGRAEGGLGIGLSLARRLVEMHGGTVEAASDGVGKGCLFSVRLALAEDPATADLAKRAPGTAQDHTPAALASHKDAKRILVVDDNQDSAESLTMLLRLLGHEVREAFDGHRALELLDEFVPDLLLLDIGLPGMDGYEVAKQVRSRPALRGVRLVALSGYGSPEDRSASRSAGFDDHVVKPIEFSLIETLLASI